MTSKATHEFPALAMLTRERETRETRARKRDIMGGKLEGGMKVGVVLEQQQLEWE